MPDNTGLPIKSPEIIKAILHVVLLYGREIWLVTDTMTTILEGLHHRISIHIAGMTARRGNIGECEWS